MSPTLSSMRIWKRLQIKDVLFGYVVSLFSEMPHLTPIIYGWPLSKQNIWLAKSRPGLDKLVYLMYGKWNYSDLAHIQM